MGGHVAMVLEGWYCERITNGNGEWSCHFDLFLLCLQARMISFRDILYWVFLLLYYYGEGSVQEDRYY